MVSSAGPWQENLGTRPQEPVAESVGDLHSDSEVGTTSIVKELRIPSPKNRPLLAAAVYSFVASMVGRLPPELVG